MKIGIDASKISISQKTGTENYSYNLIRELLNIDKKNEYMLYLRENPPQFITSSSNVTYKKIPLPRLWTQAGLASEVLFNPPDVLFIPAHTMPVVHRPGLKTVVTIHDLGAEFLKQYHQFPQKLYLNKSTEFVAKFATKLIAVSEATKKDLVTKLGVSADRITVVPEAWDRELFHIPPSSEVRASRSKYHLDNDYLIFVSTIQPRKNLERLIEAFSKAKIGLDLVLVGKPGWLSEPIYLAPKKFGVADRVKFLGHVPNQDLPGLYGGARAMVFPSLYEGFGIPVLEAMACGTVVLTSNTTSLPEVGGDAAYYVDPNNIESIVKGIEDIVTKDKIRHQLTLNAIKQIQKFSWKKAAVATLKVLEKAYES